MNKQFSLLLAILLATLFASTAACAADLEVKAPWVRGTVAGQKATGAFMTLISKKDAALVGVSSKVATVSEVHEMKMDGDRMQMREVARLELPAGKPVELARGGYHIMLMELKQPIKVGQKIALELKIEGANKKIKIVKVSAEVRDLAAVADPHAGHQH